MGLVEGQSRDRGRIGVFASGVEDAETVSNALQQLSFLIQGASGAESPLTTREVGGGQVYVIDLGDEAGSTLEFGVVGDYLVVGKGDAVDRFGEEATGSLAENAQFQAVMDTLPVEHNGLTYIDLAQAIPLMEVAAQSLETWVRSDGRDPGRQRELRQRDSGRSAGGVRRRRVRDVRSRPGLRRRSVRTTSAAPNGTDAAQEREVETALSLLTPSPMSTTRRSRRLPSSRTPMVMFSVRRPSSTSPSRLSVSRQARRS